MTGNVQRARISKVNFDSDLRYAYRTKVERQLREHPDGYALVKLIAPVIRAVRDVVENRIDRFGSTAKRGRENAARESAPDSNLRADRQAPVRRPA